jgi:hypothetical protein
MSVTSLGSDILLRRPSSAREEKNTEHVSDKTNRAKYSSLSLVRPHRCNV